MMEQQGEQERAEEYDTSGEAIITKGEATMKRKLQRNLAIALAVASLATGAFTAGVIPADEAVAAGKTTGISETRAKTIALKDAGIDKNKAKGLDAEDDKQNGKKIYEVIFFKKTADRRYDKYRYIIAWRDGQILKHSKKNITIITRREALLNALDKKDFSRSQVYDVDVDLDEDDGMIIYDVDYTSREGANGRPSRDFEFTINAENGRVVDWDVDD